MVSKSKKTSTNADSKLHKKQHFSSALHVKEHKILSVPVNVQNILILTRIRIVIVIITSVLEVIRNLPLVKA